MYLPRWVRGKIETESSHPISGAVPHLPNSRDFHSFLASESVPSQQPKRMSTKIVNQIESGNNKPSAQVDPAHRFRWWQDALRTIVWWVVRCIYRIEIRGLENIPKSGGVILTPNHLSFIDGPLLMMALKRPIRAFVWAGNFSGLSRKWADTWKPIFVANGPKSIVKALREANQAVCKGDLLLLFPEGGISRNGQLLAFRDGILRIVEGAEIPILPVYIDGVWGSIFSFSGGRFFTKWPKGWRRQIQIVIGEPMTDVKDVTYVRQAISKLGAAVVQNRKPAYPSLPAAFVRSCRRRLLRPMVSDSPDESTKGGDCLLRTLILRRLLRRNILRADEQHVGVLLPPSVGGLLTNMALAVDGRVPVHLNYTVTSDVLNQCLQVAGIQHVLTSRRVMSKLDLKLNTQLVYLEDLKSKLRWTDKVAGAVGAYLAPAWLTSWWLGLNKLRGKRTATIIFTSGSTGTPKGVVLSYDNIASNVYAIEQVVGLSSKDTVLGILPFFHSFGFTVTLWTPMALALNTVYHFSPLDARRIGELIQKYAVNVFLATPTFLRSYLKRCTREQMKSLEVVVAGAEKLPIQLCDAFEEKFGVRPVEGYGCTELSPLVSVNVPPTRSHSLHQIERKEGTVGRPVPNVAAKITDTDTGEELGPDQEGMLWITGPNVMQGYYHDDEKTARVIKDGWYSTGDLALIDRDGFIKITGRESRFSKIGGEMVPHILIEETLQKILGMDEDEGPKIAVTAVPDEARGERLIVLHTKLEKPAEELCSELAKQGLPNLFIPAATDFIQVSAIPVLGTGKIDLRGIQQKASELVGQLKLKN